MNREGQFEVEVQARDNYKHYVMVRQPGDTVYWTFATKKKNIGFGLYYLNSSSDQDNRQNLTLASSLSSESLALVRKNSQLLAKALPDATLSVEHIREILRCSQPLIHISPAPKQHQLNRSNSLEGDAGQGHSARDRNLSVDSTSSIPATNSDMISIVPVERYSSAEATVTGSLDAPLCGTYVLLFDNSFSINTAKQLTLCVSVRRAGAGPESTPSTVPSQVPATIVHGGWMLKRKRLRMQGFSKRWFKLDSTGLLTYHDDPEGPVKGGLNVRMCVITKVPPRLLLTLDSGTELFHLKALTDADYRLWCERIAQVVQSFISKSEEDSTPARAQHKQSQLQAQSQLLQSRIAEHRISCVSAMEELKEAGEKEQDMVIVKYLGKLERTFAVLNSFYTDLIALEKALSTSVQPSTQEQLPEPTEDVFYDVIIMSEASDEESITGLDRNLLDHLIVPSTEPSIAPSFEEAEAEQVQQQLAAGAQLVRLALPARSSPINVTYTQLIGRMSSRTATTPVILNEPLSLLQRQCEELEYCELLQAACNATSMVDRLAYVSAFAVSCYANCQYRYEYKPFTPMLGETFEWFDVVRGFRFLSEKVEHRPETILACQAESFDGRWSFWQELQVKTKTWGKTAELTPGGLTHVRISVAGGSDLEFRWNKVTSCIRNCLSKDVFIDNFGEMLITCVQDESVYAKVEFMKSSSDGLWGSFSTATRTGRNELSGAIINPVERRCLAKLSGRWDDYLAMEERVLWKASPPPANCRDYYGFSLLALQLNVPAAREAPGPAPTDSRFRPDQRLVEEGDIEEADLNKARLEQKQRAERSAREERGEEYEPLWFIRDDENNGEYRSNDHYFKKREDQFKGIDFPDLF